MKKYQIEEYRKYFPPGVQLFFVYRKHNSYTETTTYDIFTFYQDSDNSKKLNYKCLNYIISVIFKLRRTKNGVCISIYDLSVQDIARDLSMLFDYKKDDDKIQAVIL